MLNGLGDVVLSAENEWPKSNSPLGRSPGEFLRLCSIPPSSSSPLPLLHIAPGVLAVAVAVVAVFDETLLVATPSHPIVIAVGLPRPAALSIIPVLADKRGLSRGIGADDVVLLLLLLLFPTRLLLPLCIPLKFSCWFLFNVGRLLLLPLLRKPFSQAPCSGSIVLLYLLPISVSRILSTHGLLTPLKYSCGHKRCVQCILQL